MVVIGLLGLNYWTYKQGRTTMHDEMKRALSNVSRTTQIQIEDMRITADGIFKERKMFINDGVIIDDNTCLYCHGVQVWVRV